MAAITLARGPRFGHQIWGKLVSAVQVVGRALAVNATAEARLQQVQRMQSMTDAELARMGVQRDKIVQYVFRDIYMI